jgi:hypothetical protein
MVATAKDSQSKIEASWEQSDKQKRSFLRTVTWVPEPYSIVNEKKQMVWRKIVISNSKVTSLFFKLKIANYQSYKRGSTHMWLNIHAVCIISMPKLEFVVHKFHIPSSNEYNTKHEHIFPTCQPWYATHYRFTDYY